MPALTRKTRVCSIDCSTPSRNCVWRQTAGFKTIYESYRRLAPVTRLYELSIFQYTIPSGLFPRDVEFRFHVERSINDETDLISNASHVVAHQTTGQRDSATYSSDVMVCRRAMSPTTGASVANLMIMVHDDVAAVTPSTSSGSEQRRYRNRQATATT